MDLLSYEQTLWEQELTYVAGVDEAGRGPLAGPVVAAAVVFSCRQTPLEGVDDSKKLTPRGRLQAYQLIQDTAASVGVGIVHHREIDQINILQASLKAMRLAVEKLTLRPDYLLIDGRDRIPDLSIPALALVKGDGLSLSIAAASIIAKVVRDDYMCHMDELYPEYGFSRHKGYATRVHLQAIRRHGLCAIHRRSFHPRTLEDTTP